MFSVLQGIYTILQWLLYLYSLMIVFSAIMSWVPALSNSKFGRLLQYLVEPYLNLFRFARLGTIGLDFSPVLGLLVLYFIKDKVLFWIFNIIGKLVS